MHTATAWPQGTPDSSEVRMCVSACLQNEQYIIILQYIKQVPTTTENKDVTSIPENYLCV